jgi:hypothetical protein
LLIFRWVVSGFGAGWWPECRLGWAGFRGCRGRVAWSGRGRQGAYAGEDGFEQGIARW